MDTWRKSCFNELLYECICCARLSSRGSEKPIDDDHVLKVFTHLMLKVRLELLLDGLQTVLLVRYFHCRILIMALVIMCFKF